MTIEGLKNLVVLDSIYLKHNRIGRNGISDLIGILECPSLECLELSNNAIEDTECIEEVFVKMARLKVLYLVNNEVTKKIPSYRKTTIAKLPNLKYLDDRPVFPEDRRRAEAYARGGMDEERQEMKRINHNIKGYIFAIVYTILLLLILLFI